MTNRLAERLPHFLFGSLILCLFCYLQTILLNIPHTFAQFLLPWFLGGLGGLLIGNRTIRIKELDSSLQQANRQLEQLLEESEERYQHLFELNMAVQLLVDPETGVIIRCNEAAQLFYGYSTEEFVGKTVMELNTARPEDVKKYMQQALTLKQRSFRFKHRLKSGTIRSVEVYAVPVPLNGRVLLHSVVLDSTEKNKTESDLRRKTLEQRMLLDSIPVGIWYLRDQETFGMVNKAYAEYFNRAPKEIAHTRLDTVLSNETLAFALAGNRQVFTEKEAQQYEQWLTMGNSEPRYMAITKTPKLDENGNVEFVVCTATDITNMQRTRDMLRIERDLHVALSTTTSYAETLRICLEKAIEVSQADCGGLYLVDPQKGSLTLTAQQGLSDRFSQFASHYHGDSEQARIAQRNQPVYACSTDLSMHGTKDTLKQEGLLAMGIIPISFQGKTIACLHVASHRMQTFPKLNRIALERVAVHIGTFLTQKEQDILILQHQQNLESLFNSIQDFVFILDMEGSIISLNSVATTRLGHQQEALIGKNVRIVHPEGCQDEILDILVAMLAGEREHCLVPLMSREGERIPVETHVTRGQWNGQEVLFCLSRDISSRLEIERQQRLLLKNEGLERMAGAMAHHFNNLMAIVAGNLELATEAIVANPRVNELLNNAVIGTRRASELGQALLIYTGQFAEVAVPLNLSTFCREQIDSGRITPPENVELIVELASPGPVVVADPAHLEQALSALVTNATETIGKVPGRIALRVKTLDRDAIHDAHIFPAGWVPAKKRYGCLEIIDSGTGIAEWQMINIFDLFYSEKFLGRGLGLALALSIVKKLDGAITVASQPERGSTFQVLLPEQNQYGQQV